MEYRKIASSPLETTAISIAFQKYCQHSPLALQQQLSFKGSNSKFVLGDPMLRGVMHGLADAPADPALGVQLIVQPAM